jgi:putative ABC transport system permease protein
MSPVASLDTLVRRLRRRLQALLHPRAAELELDEELQFHLEMEIDYHIRRGVPPAEARSRALREFGGVMRIKEESRQTRSFGTLEDLWRDLRFASRSLRRTPVYALVAILTIAVGIGVTTAVFSVVDGVLLRPLPYPEPDRLVRLSERSAEYARMSFAGANFRDVQARTRTVPGLAAFFSASPITVLGLREPMRPRVAVVTGEFFDVMGIPPELGRSVAPGEGDIGGPNVALVSHAFWTSALEGDSAFSRHTLRIGNAMYPVVGVMPTGFNYPTGADVWVTGADDNPYRTAHNWLVIGRLGPGETVQSARRELDGIVGQLKKTYGSEMDAEGVDVSTLHETLSRTSRTSMLILLGAVGLVLLVVCVNLASGNLARAETRQRELAVQTALGARRGRLVRQILTENLALALVGGVLGVGIAVALTRVLAALAPGSLPGFARVEMDGRVLAFGFAASLLTGILIGVGPAFQITGRLREAIGTGTRGGSTPAHMRTRGLLISIEVALAFALLAGAGLLMRSLWTLLGQDPGFRVDRVLTVEIALPREGYGDTTSLARFYDRLLADVRSVPGIESVGMINHIPLGGVSFGSRFMVDGGEEMVGNLGYRVVDSSYFHTLGIPLLRGRAFGPGDRSGSEHVTVINQAAATAFWPGGDPTGHRVRLPGMDQHGKLWLTIVGVVADVHHGGLDQPAQPEMYVHYPQRPERLDAGATLVLTSARSPAQLTGVLRDRVRAIDANVPIRLSSMAELVAGSVASRRFSTLVLGAFGALALVLAALGIYGVLAYSVAQRQREIGVRMALGAQQGAVRGLILRDAMWAVVPGVVVGLGVALALSRLLQSLLFEVTATDPATYAGVIVVLMIVAALASWIPARRATRVDPMIAIRAE